MLKELENLLNKPREFYINSLVAEWKPFDVKRGESVVLFGAAEMGKIYLELCKKNQITVRAVCDNNKAKAGGLINGVKIISLETLLQYPKDTPIIISTIYDEEVYKQLKELEFTRVWSHAYLSVLLPHQFHNIHWLSSLDALLSQKAKVIKCFNSLEDALSRETYLAIIKYRLFLHRSYLKEVIRPAEEEYFEKDIVNLSDEEVFIDGGAYDGDTIDRFIKKTGNKFQKIYAFEPDTISFQKLSDKIKNIGKADKIALFPYGLGSNRKTLKFLNQGTLGSRISDEGGVDVEIVSLDEIAADKKVTFIKYDIEGAEVGALYGAENVIKNNHPKLAICAYHQPADLWEIPLIIKEIYPKYSLYLRHYTPFLYDTVCYAL